MIWATILLVVGLALVLLEVFVPSGGVIGTLAALAMISSLVMAFLEGPIVGLVFMSSAAVLLPAVVAGGLSVWPYTPMGRRYLLRAPQAAEVVPDNEPLRRLRALVGQVGRAKSPMLPAGAALIDGETVNVQSEGMPIEAGQLVRVVEVRGSRVIVRPVDDEIALELGPSDLAAPVEDPFAGGEQS